MSDLRDSLVHQARKHDRDRGCSFDFKNFGGFFSHDHGHRFHVPNLQYAAAVILLADEKQV